VTMVAEKDPHWAVMLAVMLVLMSVAMMAVLLVA